jgi:hypothetical protein
VSGTAPTGLAIGLVVQKTPLRIHSRRAQNAAMFLRRHTKLVGEADHTYWSLVKTIRTAKGPRYALVAHLGKLTPAEAQQPREWSDLDALLDGTPPAQQLPLGPPAPPPPAPLWRTVNVGGLRVERVWQFGRVYLTLADCRTRQRRLVGLGLLGVPEARINETRLYRGLDVLLAHKEELGKHLLERYRSWFGTRFEFLIYDVTSTYFEGLAEKNELAARGYWRDHRPDCKQVCIGLVVTPEGLPVAYEMLAGNRADVTTVAADRAGRGRGTGIGPAGRAD